MLVPFWEEEGAEQMFIILSNSLSSACTQIWASEKADASQSATVRSVVLGMPCSRRVRRANSVCCAHPVSNTLTCCTIREFSTNPFSQCCYQLDAFKSWYGWWWNTKDRLLLGDMNTISTDLVRFSCRLLSRAHSSIKVISDAHESALHVGMIRYLSWAYLSIELPGVAAWRSEALTT